jgi:hypothetical protein
MIYRVRATSHQKHYETYSINKDAWLSVSAPSWSCSRACAVIENCLSYSVRYTKWRGVSNPYRYAQHELTDYQELLA